MLAKITLENFFSFGEKTEITLNKGVNILVGINGSGKTNLLKAIRLLHEGIAGKGFQKVFLEDFGGFDEVANACGGRKDFIRLAFEFDKDRFPSLVGEYSFDFASNPTYELLIYRSGVNSYRTSETVYAKSGLDTTVVFHYLIATYGAAQVAVEAVPLPDNLPVQSYSVKFEYNRNELALGHYVEPVNVFPLYVIKKAIESISTYQQFNTSPKSPLRLPVNNGIDERLASDGTNFASLLQRMKNQNALAFDKIVETLQKVNPKYKSIDFDIIGSRIFMVLREHNLDKTISIEHISDGTLSFILMSAIFGNPNRGGLVSLDEPENDLHPDMISLIADYMKEAAKSTQIIAATHSPLLLNNFDLEDVLVFEKDADNQTKVKNYTEEDFEGQEDMLVGQFWLRGLIGGKRW